MSAQSTLTGAAGEQYAMFQLLRRQWIAAEAPKGVPRVDILITDESGKYQRSIQVKTRRDIGSDKGWHMSQKHENHVSKTLIYFFVDLGKKLTDQPVIYIIPSKVVARVLKDAHQFWLKTPGKKGRKHRDNKMRRLLPDYVRKKKVSPEIMKNLGPGWMEKYRENWALLKQK